MKPLDINKLIASDLPLEQYYQVKHKKNQIVLHHTASGPGVQGDIHYWKTDPRRIATAFVVDRNGDIYQCFNSQYWAYHLGVSRDKINLEQYSIGIEIDSWGILTKEASGKYYTWTKQLVTPENVVTYEQPFRGSKHFEKYTEAQLNSTGELVIYLANKYGIPLTFQDKIFALNNMALAGVPGIYTHASYRPDKSDVHPQPELIQLLQKLK